MNYLTNLTKDVFLILDVSCFLILFQVASGKIHDVNCSSTYDSVNPKQYLFVLVNCPPNCSAIDEPIYGVTIYAGRSSICRSAIHDGRYLTDEGGMVTTERRSPPSSFFGSFSNGITSQALPTTPEDQAFGFRADVDECYEELDDCHSNATCNNTQGSFSCSCDPGFMGDGVTNCLDINECELDSHNCTQKATYCNNTFGSYFCSCELGYTKENATECTDLDECASNPCSRHATCANNEGSFSCTCGTGYRGDGQTCEPSSATRLELKFLTLSSMIIFTNVFIRFM